MKQPLGVPNEVKLWHITPRRNVRQIMQCGLEPRLGPRSRKLGEARKAVYLFLSGVALQDALANWLGDEFEDTPISLLEVRVPREWVHADKAVGWEALALRCIPKEQVSVLLEDLDHWTGEYPNGDPPPGWLDGD